MDYIKVASVYASDFPQGTVVRLAQRIQNDKKEKGKKKNCLASL